MKNEDIFRILKDVLINNGLATEEELSLAVLSNIEIHSLEKLQDLENGLGLKLR